MSVPFANLNGRCPNGALSDSYNYHLIKAKGKFYKVKKVPCIGLPQSRAFTSSLLLSAELFCCALLINATALDFKWPCVTHQLLE